MQTLEKLWSVIEKNRWATIVPVIGIIAWVALSLSCSLTTLSPIRSGVQVNAVELELDYQTWIADCNTTAKRFKFAASDIERQREQWSKIESALMSVASGNVTSFTGLLGILTTTGLIGFGADNLRKNGVIAGLKRKKKR